MRFSIIFTIFSLAMLSGCRTDVPDQYMDGTHFETSKTNTQWMDSYWKDDARLSRMENVDPRVGPDRRP